MPSINILKLKMDIVRFLAKFCHHEVNYNLQSILYQSNKLSMYKSTYIPIQKINQQALKSQSASQNKLNNLICRRKMHSKKE